MNKPAGLLERFFWLAPLALLALVALSVLTRTQSPFAPPFATPLPGYPTKAPPTSRFPPGYPMPPTVPPAEATDNAANSAATSRAYDATSVVEATRLTGTSIAQTTADAPYHLVGPVCFVDRYKQFSLSVPDGWYIFSPSNYGGSGGATLYNYDASLDAGNEATPPPSTLRISIYIGYLQPDQTAEQWLSERTEVYQSNAEQSPITVTQPQLFSFGNFAGQSIQISSNWADTQEIFLSLENGRFMLIGLVPSDSYARQEGLSILSESLAVSPEEFCRSN